MIVSVWYLPWRPKAYRKVKGVMEKRSVSVFSNHVFIPCASIYTYIEIYACYTT